VVLNKKFNVTVTSFPTELSRNRLLDGIRDAEIADLELRLEEVCSAV